ncbi:hypothetical protein [Borreliella americana]|uniref:hypothetical protein n=1 Tax=Borreliella americana TaxID=478807 RepID=UPI001E5A3972|nr:hypothetical protein [Borreliella americana]MCD2332757.1 hypothetical protein [Borreliella americana]MCD2382663.1 hypothetical protein [Borreliella americana]
MKICNLILIAFSQQVNSQASEAKDIINEVRSSTSDYTKVEEELEKVKHTLDNMKSLADTANSYLEKARTTPGPSKANPGLLPSLREAIGNIKSRHPPTLEQDNKTSTLQKTKKRVYKLRVVKGLS